MRVLLATPSLFRVPQLEYMMSVMKTQNLLMQYNIAVDTCFVGGDCFIGKARNGLMQSFIETWKGEFPCDVIVYIDDDQSWDENAFFGSLPHLRKSSPLQSRRRLTPILRPTTTSSWTPTLKAIALSIVVSCAARRSAPVSWRSRGLRLKS
jgi:hypothetical protein